MTQATAAGYRKAIEVIRAMPPEHRSVLIQCLMPSNQVARKPVVKE